jgi:hypothetical protein
MQRPTARVPAQGMPAQRSCTTAQGEGEGDRGMKYQSLFTAYRQATDYDDKQHSAPTSHAQHTSCS